MTEWLRRRICLIRLWNRERHLAWQLNLWPDETLEPVLKYVREARRLAKAGPYPPARTGSR
jgi:hypothetical protein